MLFLAGGPQNADPPLSLGAYTQSGYGRLVELPFAPPGDRPQAGVGRARTQRQHGAKRSDIARPGSVTAGLLIALAPMAVVIVRLVICRVKGANMAR